MNEKFIEEQLSFWQYKLRLDDWDLLYKIVPITQTGSEFGCMSFTWNRRRATIEISEKCPEDMLEIVVVHELLHLYTHTMLVSVNEAFTELCSKKVKNILFSDLQIKENELLDKIARIMINLRKEK